MLDLKKLEEKLDNALEAESEQSLKKWLLVKSMSENKTNTKNEEKTMNEEIIEELVNRVRKLEKRVFAILCPRKYEGDDEVWISHWGKEFKGYVFNVTPKAWGDDGESFSWIYSVKLESDGRVVEVSEDQLIDKNKNSPEEESYPEEES